MFLPYPIFLKLKAVTMFKQNESSVDTEEKDRNNFENFFKKIMDSLEEINKSCKNRINKDEQQTCKYQKTLP